MDIKNFTARHMPQEVVEAVGSNRAKVASKMASTAAARLDRNNQFFYEPAHVYRASSWSAKK